MRRLWQNVVIGILLIGTGIPSLRADEEPKVPGAQETKPQVSEEVRANDLLRQRQNYRTAIAKRLKAINVQLDELHRQAEKTEMTSSRELYQALQAVAAAKRDVEKAVGELSGTTPELWRRTSSHIETAFNRLDRALAQAQGTVYAH